MSRSTKVRGDSQRLQTVRSLEYSSGLKSPATAPDQAIICLIAVFALLSLAPQGEASSGVLDSTYMIFHYRGTDSTSYLGAGITPIGDVNGDGFDDIAVSCSLPRGTYIFFGGDPPDTIPDMQLKGVGAACSADVTGDGIYDLITRVAFVSPLAPPIGMIYFYRGYADSLGSEPFDSLYVKPEPYGSDSTNWGFGLWRATGYADSDSIADIVTCKTDTPDGPTLYYYSGAPLLDTVADWIFQAWNRFSIRSLGFIDFNGDSHLDIFVGLYTSQTDSLGRVYVFAGPDYGTAPDIVLGPPVELDGLDLRNFGQQVNNLGDVSGDGWDDLGVVCHSVPLVYLCGPGADTVFDYQLTESGSWMSGAGDINGDGYNDVLTGGTSGESGVLWVFLAGSGMDPFWDDCVVRGDLPPWFVDQVGYRNSAAGDFNGDGIDDFMFSCTNFYGGDPGSVFVVKGSTDIVTEVTGDDVPPLPTVFELEQNYPNPFNMSTSIEFSLSRAESVSLEIYNVLGQCVRGLVGETRLRAGVHRVQWDGTNDDAAEVTSGVYLYRLTVGGESAIRKMILAK